MELQLKYGIKKLRIQKADSLYNLVRFIDNKEEFLSSNPIKFSKYKYNYFPSKPCWGYYNDKIVDLNTVPENEKYYFYEEVNFLNQYKDVPIINQELLKFETYSYEDYIQEKLKKYGEVNDNYIKITKDYSSAYKNNNIIYPKKDLYVHHIKEDCLANLSNPKLFMATIEYQTKQNLVYCDILEHCIMHALIVKENPETGLGIGGLLNYRLLYTLKNNLKKYNISIEEFYSFVYKILKIKYPWHAYEKQVRELLFNETVLTFKPYLDIELELAIKLKEKLLLYPIGITKISKEEYCELKALQKNKLIAQEVFLLRSKNNHFMFLQYNKKKRLQLIAGGKIINLPESDIQFYFDNMDSCFNYQREYCNNIYKNLSIVSEIIKSIGGSGDIHGLIVDYDYFNHVRLDLRTHQWVVYRMDVNKKYNEKFYPYLFSKEFLQTQNKKNIKLPTITNYQLSTILTEKGITIPSENYESNYKADDKDFTKISINSFKMQKGNYTGIIEFWPAQCNSSFNFTKYQDNSIQQLLE